MNEVNTKASPQKEDGEAGNKGQHLIAEVDNEAETQEAGIEKRSLQGRHSPRVGYSDPGISP